jgi:electron transport complex protein RnfB
MPASSRIPLVDQIEALLPQTQCGKCLHPGCRPYAEGIAKGEAINHCVPGGADTIADLAALLDKPVLMLDPAYGIEPHTRRVAYIREAECIGCTKCIQACPVDAIVGAAKLMHTVLSDECTGCDLCIAPCPVDCIDIRDFPKVTDKAQKRVIADHNRARYEARNARLAREQADKAAAVMTAAVTDKPDAAAKTGDKSLVIAAALARSNLKKAERKLAAAQETGEDSGTLEEEVKKLQAEVARLAAALNG